MAVTLRRVTGVPGIDLLASPVRQGWIVEVYGPESLVSPVMHRAIVEAAARGRVAVVHVQEFGGLDPYRLRRLARLRGVNVDDRVLVARAFRLVDVPGLVEEASGLGVETLVARYPYYYAPRDWRRYQELTPVTAALRRAAQRGLLVLVFNQPTGRGRRFLPEGGSFHHHSAHVIVRLDPWRRGARARLVKHPWRRPGGGAYVSWMELGVGVWGGQRPLHEYL